MKKKKTNKHVSNMKKYNQGNNYIEISLQDQFPAYQSINETNLEKCIAFYIVFAYRLKSNQYRKNRNGFYKL